MVNVYGVPVGNVVTFATELGPDANNQEFQRYRPELRFSTKAPLFLI
jgi:hypothetical protein